MKKIRIIPLILALLMLASCSEKVEEEPETVTPYATVNGETITSSEIEYFRKRDRADIVNEFSEKYGVKDFNDFWERDFDGGTPSEALEERAFEDAVNAKIVLLLMKEKGIFDEISFEELKTRAEKFNSGQQSGSVGITSIDMESFYTYYVETGKMELKNRLAEEELMPSDAEINEYVSEHKGVTKEGAVSFIVNERFDEYVSSIVEKAEIRMVEVSQ